METMANKLEHYTFVRVSTDAETYSQSNAIALTGGEDAYLMDCWMSLTPFHLCAVGDWFYIRLNVYDTDLGLGKYLFENELYAGEYANLHVQHFFTVPEKIPNGLVYLVAACKNNNVNDKNFVFQVNFLRGIPNPEVRSAMNNRGVRRLGINL